MNHRATSLRAVSASMILMLGLTACGNEQARPSASGTPEGATPAVQAAAQAAAINLVARGGGGKTIAAAFVELKPLAKSKGDDTGTYAKLSPTDQLVEVKLFGDYLPQHSVPVGVSLRAANTMVTVYDVTLGQTIQNSFYNGPPMALTSAGTAVQDPDLSVLGNAVSLDPATLHS